MAKFVFDRAVQLSHAYDRSHWSLSYRLTLNGEDHTYSLQVKVYWDGETWDHFKFGRWNMGDFVELISDEDIKNRYNTIVEHEDDGKADEWFNKNLGTTFDQLRSIEQDIRNALIRRWNAMRELVDFHNT